MTCLEWLHEKQTTKAKQMEQKLYLVFDYFGVKGEVLLSSNNLEALIKKCRKLNNYADLIIHCTMDKSSQWVSAIDHDRIQP